MSLLLGTNDVTAAYLGTTLVEKIYLGTEEIWPLAPSAPVTVGTTGTPATSGGNANILTTANAPITIGSESNRMLGALVVTSHANIHNYTSYLQLSCTGSVSGALTRLTSASVNIQGNTQGSVHLFYLNNPAAGSQNLTATYQLPGGAWGDRIRIIPFYLYNVNQSSTFGTPVTTAVNGAASNTLSTSASTSLVMFGYGGGTSPTSFNKTQMALFGSSDAGIGDYMLLGNAAGGSSQTFTTANSTRHGTWSVEVNAA